MAEPTKQDLLDRAAELEITVDNPDRTTRAELQALIEGKLASSGEIADYATGPQHPASKVEKLPDELKAGPGSHQSREWRPEELDHPDGTSAFQTKGVNS